MAKKSQVQKFRDAARAANADGSEERFNATLKDLAKSPREAKALEGETLEDLADELGQNDPTAPKGGKTDTDESSG
jgi:hypothetical protein